MRSKPLARTKARTAAIFGPCRRFSCSSGASGLRMPSPPGGQLEVGRHHDLDALGIDPHRGAAFHGLGDRLEADPAARVARHREAQDAEVEIFLDRRRIDDRDHRRGEHLLALVRQGRGLAAMVVAGERDHAAILRGAGGIAVLQHVHRAVDARALAVPDAEHAIDRGAREEVGLLAAPHRGRREVLVEAGLEVDVVLFQVALRAPQRVVVHAERRAAVARDEAAGVEPRLEVALALHHRQAHQRLDAGQVDAALVQPVAVFQRIVAKDEGKRGVVIARLRGRDERIFTPTIAVCAPAGKDRDFAGAVSEFAHGWSFSHLGARDLR